MINNEKKYVYTTVLILLGFLFGVWIFFLTEPSIAGQVYNENATVNTTVNITNSGPLLQSPVLQDPILLTAYSNTTVYCNVTVYDYDNDTVTVNATLYYEGTAVGIGDDGNNHYTNTSCVETGRADTITNFSCSFDVQFYANNGTWYCNATALDDDSATGSNVSTGSTLEPLVAIIVPGVIDYGNLGQAETSIDIPANITNAGNRDTNISVKGWGVTEGDGLAMNCTFGEISVEHEKYNHTNDSDYSEMHVLSSSLEMIPDLYVEQRTSETQDSINSTYWKIWIPTGAGGVCNGKVLFSGTDRGN